MQLIITKMGNIYSVCTHDFDSYRGYGVSELKAIIDFKTNLIAFEKLLKKEIEKITVIIDEELKE